MKKLVLLLALLPLALAAGMRPLNVVAELATGTWCGWCPDAYKGLEVMKDKYPSPDLTCIRYYNNSGDLSNSEADARDDYYGVTGYPTCVFNGTDKVVGGGNATADGSRYEPVVSKLLAEGTPFGLDVQLDIAGGKATVTATATLYNDYSGTAPKIWIALTEDDVSGEITNVTRRIVDAGTVSITKEGDDATFEETFDIDGGWNPDKLHGVAFLQINSTKEILQASSSYPRPDYHHRITAPVRMDRIAPTETITYTFYLTNVGGKSDDFAVTLDDSGLPSGWSAELTGPATLADVTLDSDESAEFEVTIRPNGNSGQGNVEIDISPGHDDDRSFVLSAVTNDVDVNVVDDDGGEEFENYFTAALDAIGKTYGVWDVDDFHLNNLASDMSPVLIWSCGWSFPSLTPQNRELLEFYLDQGGKLFLTGQDIGWDLCSSDSENSNWESKAFYHNYLHANYISDDADNTSISGVEGDPITDGMSFNIAGGDGANNQQYPSIIDPYDDAASTMLTYSTGQGAAVRAEKDDYRVVYLAFGYEAIDNPTSRRELLEKSLDWLGPAAPITSIAEEPVTRTSPTLTIEGISRGTLVAFYNIPSRHGRIDVYDALGRRVAGAEVSGPEGRVELNLNHLAAGCYFVRLKSKESSTTCKTLLLH